MTLTKWQIHFCTSVNLTTIFLILLVIFACSNGSHINKYILNGLYFAGVFEKIGIEPQVERIGKYKSAGDQLSQKSISKENFVMLTSILENIYGNWLDTVSSYQGVWCSFSTIPEELHNCFLQILNLHFFREEAWWDWELH